jgi:DNA/RNA-binding domain of Phe-tRNA-synthetase-like protein
MPETFLPTVAAAIFGLRADYSALSVVAENVANAARHPVSDAILEAACDRSSPPEWAEAHLEAWRAAYRGFGAKPQRTPCSAEALLKRVLADGRLPTINAAVDLYNALSVRFAIPIGGENVAAYAGSPRLVRAAGHESFDTLKDGAPAAETVPAGEVIWADERGATCRRWNWRQGVRTRIDASTTRMWFILERLEPMPMSALAEAAARLVAALRQLSPAVSVSSALITRSGVTPRPC